MHNFWNTLIKPIFQCINPKIIVEIGALDGNNTKKILDSIDIESVLHVIDPCPSFISEKFGSDRIKIHNNTSLNILPKLPAFDVGLIDGDHNWYTVYNELRIIEQMHETKNFPFLILHDVSWPYARRDMYYDPSSIPEKYKHRYKNKGMVPKNSKLKDPGMNSAMNNAVYEGGDKNGVLTAIENFINESKQEYIFKIIPAYFGFGFLISKDTANKRQDYVNAINSVFNPENLIEVIRQQEIMFIEQVIDSSVVRSQRNSLSHKLVNIEKKL